MSCRKQIACLLIAVGLATLSACGEGGGEGQGEPLVKLIEGAPPFQPIHLAWDGDPQDLNVILTARGAGPLRVVDKELVFLVEVHAWTPEGKPVEFETVRELPRPTDQEIQERIVELSLGDAIQRSIELRKGFKHFRWDWTYPDPNSVVSAEVIRRVPEGVAVGRVSVSYATPGWNLPIYALPGPGGRITCYRPEPVRTLNYGLPLELTDRLAVGSDSIDIGWAGRNEFQPARKGDP